MEGYIKELSEKYKNLSLRYDNQKFENEKLK